VPAESVPSPAVGFVGLGRMGGNMARRLARLGHTVAAWDRNPGAVDAAGAAGAMTAASLDGLVALLRPPRTVWVMLPAGDPTEQTIAALASRLEAGDIVIDGGNSFYKDDVRRAAALATRGLHYVDVGTSGGVRGGERGYCLMIGGPRAVVDGLAPLFRALAPGAAGLPPVPGLDPAATTAHEGFLYCGPAGAGHFVKMIHNGIEYGLMQAYAEGFDILQQASAAHLPPDQRYHLDLAAIAEVWRRGSVVSSWLLDLTAAALAEDPALERFTGRVGDSGEGRWALAAAIDEDVPADALARALFARFRSRRDRSFQEQLLSALRAQFGGHVE
jgi:6-phosphogluconate dehydrogenase